LERFFVTGKGGIMEPDWELKDRRIAWMNINSACSEILSARINIGLKHKDNKDAIKDLLSMIDIEFQAFLNLASPTKKEESSNGDSSYPPKKQEEYDWFCSECAKGVTERVKEFSNDKFGLILCFDCQKKARDKIENAGSKKDLM
jgi:hypothetical protein